MGRRAASRSECVHFATAGLLRKGQAESGLAFCAARWHIAAARYRDCCRVPAALLGRFLPRLGPLAPASGPFFADVFPRQPIRALTGGPKLGPGPQAPADRPCANRDAAMR